jgi:hypothetical protein
MVFMEECSVERNEGFPVVAGKCMVRLGLSSRSLSPVDVDALGFNHSQASVNTFHLRCELLLGNWAAVRLK